MSLTKLAKRFAIGSVLKQSSRWKEIRAKILKKLTDLTLLCINISSEKLCWVQRMQTQLFLENVKARCLAF